MDAKLIVPLLRMSAPIVLTQLAGTMMQFADAWMVAPLGANALAAILPAGLMYFVVISLVFGAQHTVNTFVAQCFGQHRYRDCGVYTWQAIWLGLIFAALVLPACLIPDRFFMFFGHSREVADLEQEYFAISMLGAGPMLASMALSNFFIGIQRPRIPMAAAFIAMTMNLFFNWIFIYGNLGAPEMGIGGAALGTVLASVLMMVILLAWFLTGSISVRYSTRAFRIRKQEFRDLLRIGLPSGVQSLIDITAWGVVLIWFIGRFGTVHLAATTIIVRYLHLSLLPVLGLGGALTALVAQAVGAGDHGRARLLTNTALAMGLVYMLVFSVLFVAFRDPMVRVFTQDAAILEIATHLVILIAIFLVGDTAHLLYGSSLRAVGDTGWIARWTFGLCVIFMGGGGALSITVLDRFASFGPWTCGTLYIWLLAVAFAFRWHGGGWRKTKLFGAELERVTV